MAHCTLYELSAVLLLKPDNRIHSSSRFLNTIALDSQPPLPQAPFNQALASAWCHFKNFPDVFVKIIVGDITDLLSHTNWQAKFLESKGQEFSRFLANDD